MRERRETICFKNRSPKLIKIMRAIPIVEPGKVQHTSAATSSNVSGKQSSCPAKRWIVSTVVVDRISTYWSPKRRHLRSTTVCQCFWKITAVQSKPGCGLLVFEKLRRLRRRRRAVAVAVAEVEIAICNKLEQYGRPVKRGHVDP